MNARKPIAYSWRWIVAYILNLFTATAGVWFSARILGEMTLVPLIGRKALLTLLFTPPYLMFIAVGVLTGYLSRFRWRGPQAEWVWVLPAIYLSIGILEWLKTGFSLTDSLTHFFGRECLSPCFDQRERTLPFYTTVAYGFGSLVYRRWRPRAVNPACASAKKPLK